MAKKCLQELERIVFEASMEPRTAFFSSARIGRLPCRVMRLGVPYPEGSCCICDLDSVHFWPHLKKLNSETQKD